MKEFKHNLVIEFTHNGERIRHRIDVKNITCRRKRRIWYSWDHSFMHKGVKYTVYGSIDSDGDPRTDGPINDYGIMAFFYVQTGHEHIDDVDVVATDEGIERGSVYITVRLDFEYDAKESKEAAAQELVSEVDYEFQSDDRSLPCVVATEICGIND